MCVAIGTAVAIGSIAASTAGTVYAAKKGSDAAKGAAKTQQDAATEARNLQEQRYQQSRQDFNPYQQAGASSLARLGSAAGAPRQQFNGAQPGGGFQMPQQPPLGAAGGPPMPQQGQPGGPAMMQPQSQPQGRTVTLRAPDGTTHQFPEQAVPQVIAAARAKGDTLQVVG